MNSEANRTGCNGTRVELLTFPFSSFSKNRTLLSKIDPPPLSSHIDTLVTRDVLVIFIENSPRLDPCQTRRTACDPRKKEVTFSPFERIFFFFFFILRSGSRVSESRVARSLEKECFNWRHRQRRELVRSFVRQICIRRKVAGKGWRERRRVPRHDYIPFLSQCSEEI